MLRITVFLVLGLLLPNAGAAGTAGDTADARARSVVESPKFKAAVAAFERDHERFVNELIQLTEIPAPTFSEGPRAQAFAKLLREAGIAQVEFDAVGNVLGLRRGRGDGPVLALAAHLDTVFSADTDVTVKRHGTRLSAPGIGDDTRGLAFLLALARALRDAELGTTSDLLLVADVGEEGIGNLKGTRHLLTEGPWKNRITRFIAIDGRSNDLIANGALGSIRYRVTFKGPGGHSWGAFGQVSPAFAMANAITKLGRLSPPKNPKVSYNVGVVSGGTSVNSIPFATTMEVDMRSVSPEELRKIETQFKRLVEEAVAEENATRGTTFGRITAEFSLLGERPSGLTSPDSPILRQVAATMRLFDKVPVWETSSTDANIPISLGIPAFAMATQAANRGGRSHALDEWTDVEKTQAVKDFSLALAIILSIAEMP